MPSDRNRAPAATRRQWARPRVPARIQPREPDLSHARSSAWKFSSGQLRSLLGSLLGVGAKRELLVRRQSDDVVDMGVDELCLRELIGIRNATPNLGARTSRPLILGSSSQEFSKRKTDSRFALKANGASEFPASVARPIPATLFRAHSPLNRPVNNMNRIRLPTISRYAMKTAVVCVRR